MKVKFRLVQTAYVKKWSPDYDPTAEMEVGNINWMNFSWHYQWLSVRTSHENYHISNRSFISMQFFCSDCRGGVVMIGKKLRLTDQLGEMLCETTNYIACGQPAESTFIAPVLLSVGFNWRQTQLKADTVLKLFSNVHRNQLSRFRLQFEKAALGLLQKWKLGLAGR